MLKLCSRVTRDEVLHVEVATQSGTFEDNLMSIAVHDLSTTDPKNRVNGLLFVPIHVRDNVLQLGEDKQVERTR